MDLLNGKIKLMYFRYLSAAFGSAMITSVYSIVDTAGSITARRERQRWRSLRRSGILSTVWAC